jgi:hypothetical protein
LRSATSRYISTAQFTASTALANSTSKPSPVVLTMRARRLSPFDPYTFLCALAIAIAHLAARRFEQAIE